MYFYTKTFSREYKTNLTKLKKKKKAQQMFTQMSMSSKIYSKFHN